jgi:hypothetical protein
LGHSMNVFFGQRRILSKAAFKLDISSCVQPDARSFPRYLFLLVDGLG